MSNGTDIVVRVGAALDRSFDVVMGDVARKVQRAQRAGAAGGAANGAVQDARVTARQLDQIHRDSAKREMQTATEVYRQQSKLNLLIAREKLKAETAANRELTRMARQRTSERTQQLAEEAKSEREHQARLSRMQLQSAREVNRAKRAEERRGYRDAMARDREIDRFATRTSHRATRFFFPRPEGAIGMASRIGRDLMRGAGIDTSLGGGFARATERESAGIGLANQERIATGSTKGGKFWSDVSGDVGSKLNVDPGKITELMRAFTGKTGEFGKTPEIAEKLGSMSIAAGADLSEMGDAAGYVYNQLKDMPDAAERTLDVMRGIVGQTAVGAVEMKDYAAQMGRVAANAKMFQGDVSKNILTLSALTQLSIAEGGATSGADAARSIAAFAQTTSKGQRIKAFKEQGVELFNKEGTQKRDIMSIIKDSLLASKGNIPAMTKMWADTLGQKPIRGITNAFNKAGGGEEGWKAAEALIAPFMKAQMTKDVEAQNVQAYNESRAAKAQKFQNSLDKITTYASDRLLPALERLAPTALQVADGFAKVVAWATENPGKAITAAIVGSIARAGLESGIRMLLDRAATSMLGGVVGNAAGGAVGTGAAGLAGRAVAGLAGASGLAPVVGTGAAAAGTAALLVGVGVAAYSVTSALLEMADASRAKSQQDRTESTNDAFFAGVGGINKASNPIELETAYHAAQQKVRDADLKTTGNSNLSVEAVNAMRSLKEAYEGKLSKDSGSGKRAQAMGIDTKPGEGITEASLVRALSGALTGQTINVQVRNFDDMPSNMTPVDGQPNAPTAFRW